MQTLRCQNCNKKLCEYDNLVVHRDNAKEQLGQFAFFCPRCKIINRVTVAELRNVNKPA